MPHAASAPLLLLLTWCLAADAAAAAAGLGVQQGRFPSNQGDVSVKGVVDAIRFALVGSPDYHAKQPWPFDPEEGRRRSRDFQALNGYLSSDLIERLGLGEDGRAEERKLQQAERDREQGVTPARYDRPGAGR